MRAHISPIDASFAHHGEGFLAGRARDGARYGVVKVSAVITISIRNPRNDAYRYLQFETTARRIFRKHAAHSTRG
jgi:hypothetical protein